MDRERKEREVKEIIEENVTLRRIPRLAENSVQTLKDEILEFAKIFAILLNDVDVKCITGLQSLLSRIIPRLLDKQLDITFLSFLESSLTDAFFRSHVKLLTTFEYKKLTLCDKLKIIQDYWIRLDCRCPTELQRMFLKIIREPPVPPPSALPVSNLPEDLEHHEPLMLPASDPPILNHSGIPLDYTRHALENQHLFDTSSSTLPVSLSGVFEIEPKDNIHGYPSTKFPQMPLHPAGILGRGSPHGGLNDMNNQTVSANHLPTRNGVVYDQFYGMGRMFDIQPYATLFITPVDLTSVGSITRAFIPAGYNLSSSLATVNDPFQVLPPVEISQILSEGCINIVYDNDEVDNVPTIYRPSSTVNPCVSSSSSSSNPYANVGRSAADSFSRFNQVDERRLFQNVPQDPANLHVIPASSPIGLNYLNQTFPTNSTLQREKTGRQIPIDHIGSMQESSSSIDNSSSSGILHSMKDVDPSRMEDPPMVPVTPVTPVYKPRLAGGPYNTARMSTGKRKIKSPADVRKIEKRLLKRKCERLQVRLSGIQANWGQEWVSVKKRFAKLLDIYLMGERFVRINLEKLTKFVDELESVPKDERTESRDRFTEQLSIIEVESSPSTSSMESSPGPSPLSQTVAPSTIVSTPPPLSQTSSSSLEADNKQACSEISELLQQFYDLRLEWPTVTIQIVANRIDHLRPESTSAWLENLRQATPEQRQEQMASFMQTFNLIDALSTIASDDPSSLGFR